MKSIYSNSVKSDWGRDRATIKRELDNKVKQYSEIIQMLDETQKSSMTIQKKQKSLSWFRRLMIFRPFKQLQKRIKNY